MEAAQTQVVAATTRHCSAVDPVQCGNGRRHIPSFVASRKQSGEVLRDALSAYPTGGEGGSLFVGKQRNLSVTAFIPLPSQADNPLRDDMAEAVTIGSSPSLATNVVILLESTSW
jgi:hypothetical protein